MTGRRPDGRPGALRRVFRLPFSRARLRGELDDELAFHVQGRVEELMAAGLSRDAAVAEALRRFGTIDRIREEMEMIDIEAHRRATWTEALDTLAREARHAVRGLSRRPAFAAVVILTLALGIGANTAIFSVVEGVLLRPVPAPALDRLLTVREDLHQLDLLDAELSPGETVDLIARKDLFQTGAGLAADQGTLTGLGEPQRLAGAATFGEFFTLFGVRPYLGRLYGPRESEPGGPDVAVLSYAAWRELTGGDPGIVGRSIDLSGTKVQVIGVLPPDFRYPHAAQFFRPFVLGPHVFSREMRGSLFVTPLLRLRDGVTMDRVRAGLANEVDRWRQRFPDALYKPGQFVLRPVPFVDLVAGTLRPIVLVLLGAVALVLLIACANVASLQLVRASGRAREMAVRAALGAGRRAIIRQSLVESLLLALAGGLLGVGVGELLLGALARADITRYELLRDVHLDARVLAVTTLVSIAAGLAFGLVPALRAGRVDLQESLRESARGSSSGARQHRFLQGSVVVQVALTVVLLLGSALAIRSLSRLLDTDPGFRPAQVTSLRLSPPGSRYDSGEKRVAFYDALLRRLRGIPGFQDVGLSWGAPFTSGGTSSPFEIRDRPAQAGDPPRHANMRVVYGDYFRTMGIPVLRGRAPLPSDNAPGEIVVVIDEHLAKQFFPGQDPVGRIIGQGRPATIIGVVGDVASTELGEPPHPSIYYNYPHFDWIGSLHVVVRSALPSASVIAQVRAAVRDMDRDVASYDVRTMSERIAQSVAPRRLAMLVLTGFAVLSLVLAILGIYGVLSYTTAQRTQEIGIRMALGADAPAVVRMVLRGGLLLALAGIVAGLLVFAGLGRTLRSLSDLQSLLFGVGLWDPLTLGTALGVVALASALACWLPARRAATIDPVTAMRGD